MAERRQQSVGRCMLCGKTVSKGQMTRHIKKCVEQNTEDDGQSIKLFHLIIEGKYLPMYWLHVEIPGAMTLADLDSFLRDIWLECCGHLSGFTIDEQRYSAHPAGDMDMLFGSREETMNKKIYRVLSQGTRFHHEYDYGSTTELKLRVVDVRERQVRKPEITLLARNEPPALMCAKCGKPATQVQAYGWGLDLDALFCSDCVHEDEEMCLPLVNSPRTGVCGYCGPESATDEM